MQVARYFQASQTVRADGKRPKAITIFFGLWDIWQYSSLEPAMADDYVAQSVTTLFDQLSVLVRPSNSSDDNPLLIIPKVFDPTWLPSWFVERSGLNGSDRTGKQGRQAVRLTKTWNDLLEKRSSAWNSSRLVIPDFNDRIIKLMRDHRHFTVEQWATDTNATLPIPGPFDELIVPCTQYNRSSPTSQTRTCQDPSRHLFWYDPCTFGLGVKY